MLKLTHVECDRHNKYYACMNTVITMHGRSLTSSDGGPPARVSIITGCAGCRGSCRISCRGSRRMRRTSCACRGSRRASCTTSRGSCTSPSIKRTSAAVSRRTLWIHLSISIKIVQNTLTRNVNTVEATNNSYMKVERELQGVSQLVRVSAIISQLQSF